MCFGSLDVFPWFLVLLCFRSSDIFLELVFFKCLPHPLRRGTTVLFLYFFLFPLSLSICLSTCLVFLFVLVFFHFSIPENVYAVPIIPSTMTWHCIGYCDYCMRDNVVSLWRGFVTTYFVSL